MQVIRRTEMLLRMLNGRSSLMPCREIRPRETQVEAQAVDLRVVIPLLLAYIQAEERITMVLFPVAKSRNYKRLSV
jgi:hypothetical protein